LKIGIDVDDVCANFQKRFVELLHDMYGRPPLGTAPIDWNWSNCEVSGEEMGKAWKRAAQECNLWAFLEPLPSFDEETIDLLGTLVRRHDVYFVTNRFEIPGSSPLKQTKHWFYFNARIESPNVMIAKEKGPMASVLQLDAFIDDKPQNCIDVLEARPNAKVYLCDSSHNQPFNDPRIPRVKDLKEFLKLILEAN
jgi:5'(3')-deoxyribonucleotidase